jgi:SAM-dependent methyltransferase
VSDLRHFASYSPENVPSKPDGRLFSPSFPNNGPPIRAALHPWLDGPCRDGRGGTVLEIGSGTGEHIAHLALEFPGLTWVPSDIYPAHHASISAWGAHLKAANLAQPIHLDGAADWAASDAVQALGPLTAVFCCNVLHIAPWSVAEGVVRGAARKLAPGGVLILYGAFREGGRHTGEGNVAFDAILRDADPEWGVRDLDEVAELAARAGLGPAQVTRLPANNLLVVFARP